MNNLRLIAICVALALTQGCVYTKVTTNTGVGLTRISFFGNQQIGEVDLTKGTMKGYVSEQSQAAAAVVDAAVRAAVRP